MVYFIVTNILIDMKFKTTIDPRNENASYYIYLYILNNFMFVFGKGLVKEDNSLNIDKYEI